MIDLGKVKPGSTIRIPFGSYAASTGASSAASSYAAADIQIYKDGSTTQRASASGITATTDLDALTGINMITIDLSDNTTADFYAAGSEYLVVVADITVDSQTVRFPAARFVIGMDGAALDTTIATLSSQTSFTLTAGPADNNALVGCDVYIHDAASGVQCAMGTISAYTGSTKTVTLAADPAVFTMAAKDNISIYPRRNVYSAGGTVWSNASIASVTGAVGSVTGNVGGNVTGSVGSIASGGITEASYATTAGSFVPLGIIDQGTAQSATSTTLVLRSAASFANSEPVGSVILITGGSAGVGQARTITAYVGSTDTATVDAWTTTPTGTITYKIFASPAATAGSAAALAAAVWDLATSGHTTSGTFGAAMSAAGAAGDPWSTSLPGSYGAGTAGYMLNAVNTKAGYLPSATAGAAGGLTIAGSNAATTFATLTSTGAFSINGTNTVAQTGDSFARIGSAGAGLTAIGDTRMANLDAAVSTRLATAGYSVPPTVGAIADQVWDEVLSGHATSGTAGAGLTAAGSAGDPWSTAIPGSYGAGTAGYILGTNLNATVSSRLPTANYTAPLDASGTRTALGMASANFDTQVATLATASALSTVGSNVTSVKTKTDSLTFTVSGHVDANIQRINDVVITGNGQSGNEFNV